MVILYRWILYHLNHHGSPRILEWVAYPFSRGTPQPRNWTRVSCIASRFFTSWASQEALKSNTYPHTHTTYIHPHTHWRWKDKRRVIKCGRAYKVTLFYVTSAKRPRIFTIRTEKLTFIHSIYWLINLFIDKDIYWVLIYAWCWDTVVTNTDKILAFMESVKWWNIKKNV